MEDMQTLSDTRTSDARTCICSTSKWYIGMLQEIVSSFSYNFEIIWVLQPIKIISLILSKVNR